MSKAKERAEKKYPAWRNGIGDEFSQNSAYYGYIEGYHQAEKDLEEAVNAYIGYAPEVDESSSTYGKRQAFKAGANWKEQQMMAKAVDVTIAIPYQNGYCGYTQLVDSKDGLPFGENLKVFVIKKEIEL